MTKEAVKRLLAVGGKLWEKGGKSRLYFNNLHKLYGLEYTTRESSGTILSATLNGEEISNGEANRLLNVFSEIKVWYDLTDSKFYYRVPNSGRYDTDEMAKELIEKIKTASTSISDENVSELPELKRPPTLLDSTAEWCEKYGVTLPPELTLLTPEELTAIPDFFAVMRRQDPVVYIHLIEEADEDDEEFSEYFIYALENQGNKACAYRLIRNRPYNNLVMRAEVNLSAFQRENVWRLGRADVRTGRYDRDLAWEPRPCRKELQELAGTDKPIAPIGAHGITHTRGRQDDKAPRDIYGAPMMRTSTGRWVTADEWDDIEGGR